MGQRSGPRQQRFPLMLVWLDALRKGPQLTRGLGYGVTTDGNVAVCQFITNVICIQ